MMNGFDISNWQKGMDVGAVPGDFVIMKATEGTYFTDPEMETFFAQAVRCGKLRGLYHFASGKATGRQEAEYFVEHIRKYVGGAVLVLDWEGEAKDRGVAYAREFLDTVHELTGVWPLLYISKGLCRGYDWSAVASSCGLWAAQYANYVPVHGYQEDPWTDSKGWGAWKAPTILQYTSSGYLSGWDRRLDLDKAYLTKEQWIALATPEEAPKKSVEQVAREVLAGEWGNGEERKRRLTAEGYDYAAVQQKVNELVKQAELDRVAREVIAGKWGNGLMRRIRLAAAGYSYSAVQAAVNRIMSGR